MEPEVLHRSDASQNDHKSKGYLPIKNDLKLGYPTFIRLSKIRLNSPIPLEFWWSTDILSASICLQGVDQEILPCGQGMIDSVKINPDDERMQNPSPWEISWASGVNFPIHPSSQKCSDSFYGIITCNAQINVIVPLIPCPKYLYWFECVPSPPKMTSPEIVLKQIFDPNGIIYVTIGIVWYIPNKLYDIDKMLDH